MDKETLIAAVKTSVSEVLEKMFFLPLDFHETANLEECLDSDIKKLISCRLDFGGPFSGYCRFFIPKKLAQSITADFMGNNEGNVSEEQITDTVKETVNMIAGNSFSIYDDLSVFDLGLPEIASFEKTETEVLDSRENIIIAITAIDDHRLAVQVVINS